MSTSINDNKFGGKIMGFSSEYIVCELDYSGAAQWVFGCMHQDLRQEVLT